MSGTQGKGKGMMRKCATVKFFREGGVKGEENRQT